jgi:hypothetical protein
MNTRAQNEKKFGHWDELPGGGRRYWLDVVGRVGWRARYLKEVDAQEITLRFWQEIYDEQDKLVEVHEKYPLDKGHRNGKCRIHIMFITKQTVANKIAAYLRHDISLAELVSWAEDAMMEGEFAEGDMNAVSGVVSRLGVADVRAFGLAWEDCEELLRQLGYSARVEIVAA